MNKIEKMIQEMCPKGVEWKKMGEVCEIKKGKQLNKELLTEFGKYPAYNGGKTFSGRTNEYNVDSNTIIISQGGASAGYVNFVKEPFWANAHCYYIVPNENKSLNRYLYHFIKCKQNYFMNLQYGSGIPALKQSILSELLIPIPPLKIQEEIAKILDIFEKCATELQAELQQRYKQYNYYRDMMLSEEYLNKLSEKLECSARITYVLLEEVVKIKNGKDWKGLEKGEIPVYGSGGEMNEYVNKSSYNKPTVLIPRKGSLNNVYYLDTPFWNVDTIFYTEIDEKRLHPKYFYYFMENYDLYKLSNESTRPSVTQSSLNKLLIPLAPLYIQKQIVKVLDKFQDYINETKGLLPKEIEQRKKQYEYYREKLLTFEAKYAREEKRREEKRIIINSSFFKVLKEAAELVGVQLTKGVEWKSLGEIGVEGLKYGSGASAIEYDNKVRYIRITDIDENGKLKLDKVSPSESEDKYVLNKEDILFARSGATVGKNYIHQDNEKAIYAGYLIRLIVDKRIALPKYVYHCINTTKYYRFVEYTKSDGTQPNINAKQYSSYKIPVPSLEVQEYIVSKLDKFDKLVNDIKEGLPKEIELRKKEYEYYREKLLRF